MPPAWRLAINSLSGRRSRTGLLVLAVALSASLISAVACAMASLTAAVEQRIQSTVGAADARVRHVGGTTFDAAELERVRSAAGVTLAVPRARDSMALLNPGAAARQAVIAYGIDPSLETRVRPLTLLRGRLPGAGAAGRDEVTLDTVAAEALRADVGTVLEVERFGEPMSLTVVGIAKPPPLGAIIVRAECYLDLETWGRATGRPGRVGEIDLLLGPEVDATAFADALGPTLPKGLLAQPTEKITSGLNRNLQSNRLGLVIASALSFLAASFIIMTGMTTGVTERTRELAILRCVGSTRGQLARAQLLVGLIVGSLGAVLGVPLGVLAAWTLVRLFPDDLPGGFSASALGVVLAGVGAVGAGLAGAAWPAIAASRVSPLTGLSVRARGVHPRWVGLALLAGAGGVGVQALLMALSPSADAVFWTYVLLGLPALMTGYFLLGVPLMWALARGVAPMVSLALRLPRGLLGRTVAATPFRHGFTAGAMMLGLAMLISIWTNGRSVMRDWLGAIELPDAFVYGLNFRPEVQTLIEGMPEVERTCAITVMNLETGAFGIRGLSKYKTSFVGFEPEAFFAMTRLKWVQGEEATARRRLEAGGAVIVSREFLVTRGIGLGETIELSHEGRTHSFEVVGVVASPGLDIVSKFVEVGEQYVEQSVNAVCGSRRDLIEKFGNDAINFVQIGFAPGTDGGAVLKRIREQVGTGILIAVSATEMKEKIRSFIGGSLLVASVVGVGAMLVACLGVANLIIAGIHARQFEFGVLRAVGADRQLLGRLVLGEAVLIALGACVLGTLMGLQIAWAGQQLTQASIGLVLALRPEIAPIVAGWAAVGVITLGAALPSVARLLRRQPRELLAAARG